MSKPRKTLGLGSMLWCLLLSLLSSSLSTVAAQTLQPALVLILDGQFRVEKLGHRLNYRIVEPEEKAAASPQEALNAQGWQVSDQGSLSFGFSSKPSWLLFGIVNPSSEPRDLLLEISNPYLDHIDIYHLNEREELLAQLSLGDKYPASQRPLLHANFLAPLTLAPNTESKILLYVETTSTNRIPLSLWDRQHFLGASYKRTLFQSVIYGVFLAISAYYLLLFLYIRERAYLYWSCTIFGFLVIVLSLDGSATALLWPDHISWSDYFIILGICGTCGVSLLFSKEALNLAERPRLAWVINALLIASLLVWCSQFLIPYQLVLKLALLLALVNATAQLSIYLIRLFDGYAPARYVVIAIVFGSMGVVVNILTVSGRLPSTLIGNHAVGIGVSLAVLFYSLALSYHMNLVRAARELAQSQLTADLEHLVQARTLALQQANEQLRLASITDGLTGLLNRRHFDDLFSFEYRNAYRQKRPIAVLMMDIDHFKLINDTYGHPFGDLCLKTVAVRILASVHRPPDICARYGGEEFIVVLPNTSLEGAVRVAEDIRRAIAAKPISDDVYLVNISMSIGVAATTPLAHGDQSALMQNADACLYRAKQLGRNRVEYA